MQLVISKSESFKDWAIFNTNPDLAIIATLKDHIVKKNFFGNRAISKFYNKN